MKKTGIKSLPALARPTLAADSMVSPIRCSFDAVLRLAGAGSTLFGR